MPYYIIQLKNKQLYIQDQNPQKTYTKNPIKAKKFKNKHEAEKTKCELNEKVVHLYNVLGV